MHGLAIEPLNYQLQIANYQYPPIGPNAVPSWADSPCMPHSIIDLGDVPPVPVLYDRRKSPDRRREWRGGRRDSDWTNRPPVSLTKLERQLRMTRWRRAFASLHLW